MKISVCLEYQGKSPAFKLCRSPCGEPSSCLAQATLKEKAALNREPLWDMQMYIGLGRVPPKNTLCGEMWVNF